MTHPDRNFGENVCCQLPLIEGVLFEHPGVKIVISSSWREHYELDDMRELFDSTMRDRVIGVTPVFERFPDLWPTGTAPEYERQWECELWMDENRHHGSRWLAIDDRPNWFSPDCQNLLVTNPEFGFMPDDQVTLRKMLGDRK